MKPLIILIASFVIALLILHFTAGAWPVLTAGNIAMALMLCFTALGHFKFPKSMSMMLPPFVPYRLFLVIATGFLEIVFAAGLLISQFRQLTATACIVFFVLMLPANIYAATQHIDYQKGTYDGPGPKYLWFRVPLQLFFIAWLYYFSL